jgi:hypothetical protein
MSAPSKQAAGRKARARKRQKPATQAECDALAFEPIKLPFEWDSEEWASTSSRSCAWQRGSWSTTTRASTP